MSTTCGSRAEANRQAAKTPRKLHPAKYLACLLLLAGCRGSRQDPVSTPPSEPKAPDAGQVASPSAPAWRPVDIVLVTIDTLRPDRLGCYGHTGKLTPRLD